MICADSCKMRNVRRSGNEGAQCVQQTKTIKIYIFKNKKIRFAVLAFFEEATAIGVAIQSWVTRWVPGRWQCAAGGEALARWAGQVEAPGHDAGAGLPLRTCCRQARRVCEPVILILPLTRTLCKKTTLADKLSIGGQSHRNPPHANEYGGLCSRWPPPVFA